MEPWLYRWDAIHPIYPRRGYIIISPLQGRIKTGDPFYPEPRPYARIFSPYRAKRNAGIRLLSEKNSEESGDGSLIRERKEG